jgi:hypothetical protein
MTEHEQQDGGKSDKGESTKTRANSVHVKRSMSLRESRSRSKSVSMRNKSPGARELYRHSYTQHFTTGTFGLLQLPSWHACPTPLAIPSFEQPPTQLPIKPPAQSLPIRRTQLANPLISTHHLLRKQGPAEYCRLMLLMSESSGGISNNCRMIPKIVRESRGTFHTSIRRHSNNHDVLNISLAELIVKVGALEGRA